MDHIAGSAGQLPGHGRRSTGPVLLRHQDGVRSGILIGLLWAYLAMANATICTLGSIALSPSPFRALHAPAGVRPRFPGVHPRSVWFAPSHSAPRWRLALWPRTRRTRRSSGTTL